MESRLLGYVLERGADPSFTRYFWKGCEPILADWKQYQRFAEVIRLSRSGNSVRTTTLNSGVKISTVHTWIHLNPMPKIPQYLKAFITLGTPREGWVWLSVRNSPGHATPFGPFVQVPRLISSWRDIDVVLAQLHPIGPERSNQDRCTCSVSFWG